MNVAIYDTIGRLILTTTTYGTVDVSALNSGLYLLKIKQGKLLATEKLVVY